MMKPANHETITEAAGRMLAMALDDGGDWEQSEMFGVPGSLGAVIVTVRIVAESTAMKLLWEHVDRTNQDAAGRKEPHDAAGG